MTIEGIISFIVLIYSVILHEVAHGFVADKLGDPTARLEKRLTLDPRPHIDPWMTIILPLMLFLSQSGVIFGAAKPVPVDPFNFREPKKDMAIVALAGPVTNLLIAGVFAIIFRFSPIVILNSELLYMIKSISLMSLSLNVSLALFNLFPIPPLDGSKVLAGILPDHMALELYKLERFGFMIIFGILFFAPGLIYGFITPLRAIILTLLLK